MEEKIGTYSPNEFFYDNRFNDYDEVEKAEHEKRVKELHMNIFHTVAFHLDKKLKEKETESIQIAISYYQEFLTRVGILDTDVIKMSKGEFEWDLKTICNVETFLECEIIRVPD